jgi:hypothetical protein
MDAKAAPAAAAAAKPSATVEQCRVLQQVIKLLEHTEEAKKMLPLANMSPEMLQTTLKVRSSCESSVACISSSGAPTWQHSTARLAMCAHTRPTLLPAVKPVTCQHSTS